MKRILFLSCIGVFAFALFMLLRLPASVAFDRLPAGQVAFAGLSGTVWNGSAESLGVQGLQLGRTSWKIRPLRFLGGEMAYDFDTLIADEALSGNVAAGIGGQLRFTQLTGRIPVQALSALLPTGFFTGTAAIDASEVRLVDGWPASIDGQFVVTDLAALTTQPPTKLGDFVANFDKQSTAPLRAELRDLSGPIDLAGELLLNSDRSFELDATLAPNPDASPQIASMLRFVGPVNDQGRFQLRHTGRL